MQMHLPQMNSAPDLGMMAPPGHPYGMMQQGMDPGMQQGMQQVMQPMDQNFQQGMQEFHPGMQGQMMAGGPMDMQGMHPGMQPGMDPSMSMMQQEMMTMHQHQFGGPGPAMDPQWASMQMGPTDVGPLGQPLSKTTVYVGGLPTALKEDGTPKLDEATLHNTFFSKCGGIKKVRSQDLHKRLVLHGTAHAVLCY
eukprot:gene18605-25119_t